LISIEFITDFSTVQKLLLNGPLRQLRKPRKIIQVQINNNKFPLLIDHK